ncbi:Phosphatidate cytidylyltransferase [Chlamydiales bacterium STE3]|nr:Phosphatidate cytidylyltransferase [Chlamydiales bacterium STE3]
MSNFQQRLILSSAFFCVLAFAIYLSVFPVFRPIFTLLVLVVIGSALWEFYQISKKKGFEPLTGISLIGSACYLYAIFLSTQYAVFAFLPQGVLLVTLFSLFLTLLIYPKSPFINLSLSLSGICYLTLPLATLIPINFVFGRFWLVYLLVGTKMTDIGGYFSGKLLGKHKLAPSISPKKTWEGSIGGFSCSLIASVLLCWFFTDIPLMYAIFLGSLLSALAQFGDLAESLLKRDGGVKDSSHLPGLGGMLDIVDSLVFTAPTLYFLLQICS